MSGLDTKIDRREAIAVTAGSAAILLASPALAVEPKRSAMSTGRDQPFDAGWRFHKGAGDGFAQPAHNDADWRKVDLPHDWGVEDLGGGATGPFNKKAIGGTETGYTEGGEGWYRKHFRIDGLATDSCVEIAFDGISSDSEVWLNGQRLGGARHGYMPHAYDLTPHLNRDGANVIAVRARNLGKNSRWYAGSGLYRQVTLDVLPAATRIARWGVGAWTRRLENGSAEIDITTKLDDADPALTLVTILRDAKGRVAARQASPASPEVNQTLSVKDPRLWSSDSPALYTLQTVVQRGDTVVDQMSQPFGIRIVTFDVQRGMAINGKPIKLRGGCIHHDNGLLGAAAFADADMRRVRLMKKRGYNAIRSSHNPSSRNLRNACDRLGMLLIEEAFDMWDERKTRDDYAQYFAADWHNVIRAMVLSARNSPSVIMWSIGNEIPLRSMPKGVEWSWKLANAVKTLDPTRPVTAGLNGLIGQPMKANAATLRPGRADKIDNASTIFLDVPGYNYRLDDIEAEHQTNPDRIIYASETFAKEAYDYQALVERVPYMLGEFVWTAIDYLGEAGLGAAVPVKDNVPFYQASWPWVNAYCGDIDLIGDQKAASRYRDVVWGLSALEIAVQRPLAEGMKEILAPWGWSDELQSWSWPKSEGKPLTVRVYSSGDRVELLLNGVSVGSKTLTPADKQKAEFVVPFAPGRLEAVAYRGGTMLSRRILDSVSDPAKLRLLPEAAKGPYDRQALHYVWVDVLDANGRIIPDDQRKISLTVSGPADLIAFGSANPIATGSLQSNDAQSFHGRAMAILRATGKAGTVSIEARADGLQGAVARIKLA